MNGNSNELPEIKIRSNELNNVSSVMKSPSTIKPLPDRLFSPGLATTTTTTFPTSTLDVLPDSFRGTSTPDVYSMKSQPTSNPALHPPPPSSSSSISPVSRNPLASLQSAKRKRLPQDKVGQLEDRIALDARDADAWLALIKEHQAKGKISDARNTYERFFKVFPDLVDTISFCQLIF